MRNRSLHHRKISGSFNVNYLYCYAAVNGSCDIEEGLNGIYWLGIFLV